MKQSNLVISSPQWTVHAYGLMPDKNVFDRSCACKSYIQLSIMPNNDANSRMGVHGLQYRVGDSTDTMISHQKHKHTIIHTIIYKTI